MYTILLYHSTFRILVRGNVWPLPDRVDKDVVSEILIMTFLFKKPIAFSYFQKLGNP